MHRARQALETWGAAHPDIWRSVDECRAKNCATWPSYVFLPLTHSIRLISRYATAPAWHEGANAPLLSAAELSVFAS
jgi:hypothetical protein